MGEKLVRSIGGLVLMIGGAVVAWKVIESATLVVMAGTHDYYIVPTMGFAIAGGMGLMGFLLLRCGAKSGS